MKKKFLRPGLFALALLLFMVPFIVVQHSLRSLEFQDRQELLVETEKKNLRDLEHVSCSLSPAHLFGALVKRLEAALTSSISVRLAAGEILSGKALAAIADEAIQKPGKTALSLFPNEIVMIRVPRNADLASPCAAPIWGNGGHFGLANLPESTARFFLEETIVASADVQLIESSLRGVMSFPLIAVLFRNACQSCCGEYENEQGKQGFFWDELSLPESSPFRIVIMAKTRLQGQTSDQCRRVFVALWNFDFSSDAGIAFFPTNGRGRPILSRAWKREPDLQKMGSPEPAIQAAGSPLSPSWVSERSFLPHSGNSPALNDGLVLSARELDAPDRPMVVIARRLPQASNSLLIAARLLFSFFYVGIVSGGLLKLFLFGDTDRVRLWILFGFAFMLCALIPMAGVYHLSSQSFRQQFQQEKKDAREILRRHFNEIDQGITEFSSEIVFSLARAQQDPGFISAVREGEKSFLKENDISPISQLFDDLYRKIQNPKSAFHDLPGGKKIDFQKVLGMFLHGPDHLTIFKNNTSFPTPSRVMDFFATLGQKVLEIRNPELKPNRGISRPAIDKQALAIEYIAQIFIDFGGFEGFLNLMYKSGSMVPLRAGMHRSSLNAVDLTTEGKVRYIAVNIWLEEDQDFPYLQQKLSEIGKYDGSRIFAVDQTNREFLDQPGNIPNPVRDAAFQALETQLPGSAFDRAAGLLVEATPCRNLNRNILTGSFPMGPLIERWQISQNNFLIAMACGVTLAICLALGGAAIFLIPLRQITTAVRAVKDGHFETTLYIPEKNEFGSVAEAFNSMTRSLQEGKLLGRFVSDSVRQAARMGDLEALSVETRQIEATVVFSALGGFNEARSNASMEELASLLEEHLTIVSVAASRFHGEIDKLFGEKIMIVFDHRTFAGSSSAAFAATSFAAEVASRFRERKALKGYLVKMGINTGTALLGFVGSPRVRLDRTVIGDTVNLAARLASLAQTFSGNMILVSGKTLDAAKKEVRARRMSIRRIRGKTHEVEVFQLLVG
ncbi:hypothetical protein AUK22_08795 [bacterium CG2_30_54_10]|nr:MAG: hypothetical protein AUK22_08795 [bacterium CG2_30_54_10]